MHIFIHYCPAYFHFHCFFSPISEFTRISLSLHHHSLCLFHPSVSLLTYLFRLFVLFSFLTGIWTHSHFHFVSSFFSVSIVQLVRPSTLFTYICVVLIVLLFIYIYHFRVSQLSEFTRIFVLLYRSLRFRSSVSSFFCSFHIGMVCCSFVHFYYFCVLPMDEFACISLFLSFSLFPSFNWSLNSFHRRVYEWSFVLYL